jgi:hypothetical protein
MITEPTEKAAGDGESKKPSPARLHDKEEEEPNLLPKNTQAAQCQRQSAPP